MMTYFLLLLTQNDFLSLFPRIWLKIHLPLEKQITNFSQFIIQFLCRYAFMSCGTEKKDVSSTNSLALEERRLLDH